MAKTKGTASGKKKIRGKQTTASPLKGNFKLQALAKPKESVSIAEKCRQSPSMLLKKSCLATANRWNMKEEEKEKKKDVALPLFEHDIFSDVFLFAADIKDIPNICCVSRQWKAAFENVQEFVWESLMNKYHPRLAKIVEMVPPGSNTNDEDYNDDYSWREIIKTRLASTYKPMGLNQALQKDLETIFRSRGILAFTNCCRYECSDAYNLDSSFEERQEDGIFFIRFTLNGTLNYNPDEYSEHYSRGPMSGIPASYGSIEYVNKHWHKECQIMGQFCAVLGLKKGEYEIHKPGSMSQCIMIELKKPVHLERWHNRRNSVEDLLSLMESSDSDEEEV